MSETINSEKCADLEALGLVAMIVDDQPFVRHLVKQILRKVSPGHIVECKDGVEALGHLGQLQKIEVLGVPEDQLLKRHIDCVIGDFDMPTMDGIELLRRIRAGNTKAPRDLPFLMLTGHHEKQVIESALQLDVNGFVTKPVSAAGLLKRLHHALTVDVKLKPAVNYTEMSLPFTDPSEATPTTMDPGTWEPGANEPGAARQLDAAKRDPRMKMIQLPLNDIPVDSVIAEDIKTIRGGLLVGAGTVVTPRLRGQFRELADRNGIPRKAYVHESILQQA